MLAAEATERKAAAVGKTREDAEAKEGGGGIDESNNERDEEPRENELQRQAQQPQHETEKGGGGGPAREKLIKQLGKLEAQRERLKEHSAAPPPPSEAKERRKRKAEQPLLPPPGADTPSAGALYWFCAKCTTLTPGKDARRCRNAACQLELLVHGLLQRDGVHGGRKR